MLGGGHVRRRSIQSLVEASPCVHVEKRKHSAAQGIQIYNGKDDPYDSPNKARIVEKPSIASTSSYQFGGVPKRISNSTGDPEILPSNKCFLYLNNTEIPLVIRKLASKSISFYTI